MHSSNFSNRFMSQPHSSAPLDVPPPVTLLQMLSGYWVSQSIYVAAKLKIADLLRDGPKTSDELATLTGSNPRALYRLLRALASIGVFSETETSGYFGLTPLAACLQTDAPNSMHGFAVMLGEEHYKAWGELLHSVQTNASAFEQVYGMNIFEYYAQNPESAQAFDEAMTNMSAIERVATVASYDFSSFHTLVDVAGGQGSLLAAILKANPALKGILFDQDAVLAGAKSFIEAEGVLDRCQLMGGNFFESVPSGADAYVLKHILHDWDDERAIAILKNCREAMAENGKLLVVEQVIPEGNQPFVGKLLDLNMLVMCPGGGERTESEYRTLFEAAGFQLTRVVPTQGDISILEGIRI